MVTSNQEVSMIKKPKTDPAACTGDILSMGDTFDILGGKWKLLILHYLLRREHDANTFKKMEKDIEGISAKMLSKELKLLEVNKLVKREVMNTKPITVQYSITEYGKTTQDLIKSIVGWGHKHRLEMLKGDS